MVRLVLEVVVFGSRGGVEIFPEEVFDGLVSGPEDNILFGRNAAAYWWTAERFVLWAGGVSSLGLGLGMSSWIGKGSGTVFARFFLKRNMPNKMIIRTTERTETTIPAIKPVFFFFLEDEDPEEGMGEVGV